MRMIDEILTFWFGDADPARECEYRNAWFKTDPAFDAKIAERFLGAVEAAAAGDCDDWCDTAAGSLALCIALDQFPRNLFRGTARAFATDAKARDVASAALEAGHDQAVSPVKRPFLYLPFEHSENLDDQVRSVELYRALGDQNSYRYALEHHYVVSRFGRFPTRNAALGRVSTAEEEVFLADFRAF